MSTYVTLMVLLKKNDPECQETCESDTILRGN